jgi:hypothetical protein
LIFSKFLPQIALAPPLAKSPDLQNHCGTQNHTTRIAVPGGKQYISITYRMEALKRLPPSEKTA